MASDKEGSLFPFYRRKRSPRKLSVFPKTTELVRSKAGLADYRALAFIHKIIAPQGYWEETNGRLETLGTQQFIPDQALVLVFKRRPPQRPSSEFTRCVRRPRCGSDKVPLHT